MTAFTIVGRVRKAHGIRGEVVVEIITDSPDDVFASGQRVFAGNVGGDMTPARDELHVDSARDFSDGLLVHFREIPDRNTAELWRGRYLLLPESELPPLEETELYQHELLGMQVLLADGQQVGIIEELYELPHGLGLDIRRATPREKETVMLVFDERTIASLDRELRIVVVTPPDGLLD